MLSHQLAPLSQFLSSKRENWLPQLEYETVTEKSQNIRKFKGQKAKLAEASVDAPQPARECEGAHRWKGIPWGALFVPLVKRHTSSAQRELLEDWGREDAASPHCTAPSGTCGAPGFWLWNLISTWFLRVALQVEGWGLSCLQRKGPNTFRFWPEWIPRTQQRHRVWVPRDRQCPPGAYVLLPTFLLASVLYHHPEWEW